MGHTKTNFVSVTCKALGKQSFWIASIAHMVTCSDLPQLTDMYSKTRGDLRPGLCHKRGTVAEKGASSATAVCLREEAGWLRVKPGHSD